MATKFEPDRKSEANPPPSYDAASTLSSRGSEVIQSKQLSARSIVSRMLKSKQSRIMVLSRIRDLVTGPNYTPSSVAPIVNLCATALSTAKFSGLLTSPNIEGHSAIYWAIVNNRLEVVSALTLFIPEFLSHCRSELRGACMVANSHATFTQLQLGYTIGSNDGLSVRRALGCPPDEIEVHEGDRDEIYKHKFIALFRFKMCQKRLRITQSLGAEFVAGGRIWYLRIYMGTDCQWRMECGLSPCSLPATGPNVVILIEAQRVEPGCATLPGVRKGFRLADSEKGYTSLVPRKQEYFDPRSVTYSKTSAPGMCIFLGDWLMDENTPYLDDDGTLHGKFEMTLE